MNITLLHHWLVGRRGGEKVLEEFCKIFPDSPIHTLVALDDRIALGPIISAHAIKTTILNNIPGANASYKNFLPFYPLVIGHHKVPGDFILSSDASLIKGIKKDPDVPQVCYCHSPPRYLWDMQKDYLKAMDPVKAGLFKWLTPYLRRFDLRGAQNVDHFIANSGYVKERINRVYGRKATVIHPPVAFDDFQCSDRSEDFYFMVSALVPYKRVDLAVKAFNKMGRKLVIIGSGSEFDKLQAMAHDNVQLLGAQPFEKLRSHYARCKAFVFPGVEDFGITPLEAQASGKPVIAMREGGALETVIENETGLFFDRQTPDALIKAVEQFEQQTFSPDACRTNARKFRPEVFRLKIKQFLAEKYPAYFGSWDDV